VPIRPGSETYGFRWWFRPKPPVNAQVVRIAEGPQIDPEKIGSILIEINDRQWQAVREMLIEAKFKAESMLRDEKVMEHHGKLAFYSGWVAYSDYVLANLERAREDGRVERIL